EKELIDRVGPLPYHHRVGRTTIDLDDDWMTPPRIKARWRAQRPPQLLTVRRHEGAELRQPMAGEIRKVGMSLRQAILLDPANARSVRWVQRALRRRCGILISADETSAPLRNDRCPPTASRCDRKRRPRPHPRDGVQASLGGVVLAGTDHRDSARLVHAFDHVHRPIASCELTDQLSARGVKVEKAGGTAVARPQKPPI